MIFYVKESVEDIFAYELEIYPRERRIRKKQKDIYLTYCEFEILYLLARNPGRVFGKEENTLTSWDHFLCKRIC
ncbi:hypothetical protein DWX80_16250 [Ruminococcus sp. AF21-3]|nr:hypothetical protein DWX80_16250 [Ruminococcus sp. AF21-3]